MIKRTSSEEWYALLSVDEQMRGQIKIQVRTQAFVIVFPVLNAWLSTLMNVRPPKLTALALANKENARSLIIDDELAS